MAPIQDHEAQSGGEYSLGRRRVPIDVVGVPRRSARDITRPMAVEPKRPAGPTLEDLARLDSGELTMIRVARYWLERRLGKGGMASVYQGMHMGLGRPVAVKILTRNLSEHPDSLSRFMNEARLSAKIHHPNVVEVFDFGTTPEGLAYLVMQLHEGEDLRTTLHREGPLGWPRARSLLLQLCSALEAVHAQGVVHRDVKPSNCMRVIDAGHEQLLLLDFGVACKLGAPPEHAVIGTPDYMSPEQARGEPVDSRSDIYSLGIMLGELLTGHLPFTGKSVSALLDGQIHEPPPKLAALASSGTFVPAKLEAIYERALAKDPTERFASVGEFAAALLDVDNVVLHAHEPAPRSSHDDKTIVGVPHAGQASPHWRSLAIAAALALLVGAAATWAGATTVHAALEHRPV